MTPNQKLIWAAVFGARVANRAHLDIPCKVLIEEAADRASDAVMRLEEIFCSGGFVESWAYEMSSGTDTLATKVTLDHSVKQQRDSKRCPECGNKNVTENTKGTHAICLFCGSKGEIQLFKGKSDG